MPFSFSFNSWSRACVIACAATVAIANLRAQGATGAVRTPAAPTITEGERVADSLFRAGALDAALAAYRGLKGVPAGRVALVRLRTASLLGWTGKTREAAEAWRAYVRDYPLDPDGRVGLATAQGWLGEVDGAIAQLDTVLAHPGGSAAAQAQRIRLLTRAARRDDVERACANAGVAPLDSVLLGACGQALLQMGRDDAAAPLIDSLRAISPLGREARVGAATLAARRQRYADAFVLFDAWAAEHPDDGDALLAYARARSWSGDDAGAAALYARVMARQPNNAEALIGAAEVEGRQGRFAEALARLEAPSLADNLDARVTRARVLTWAGRFRDAVAAYAFVEQRDSTRREAVIGRADLQVRLGDEARGLPAFARWRAAHPDDEEAAIMHARATFFAGDPATAFAMFDSVVTRSPTSRDAVLGRATTLRALGRNGDAAAAYAAWLRRVPGDLDASIGRAASLAGSGQTAAALAAFDSLVARAPSSRDVVLGRAAVLRRMGRREDARRALGAWVASHGDDIAAIGDYAEVLLTLGAVDSAEVQYRALLAIDSTNVVPRLGLIRLAVRRGDTPGAMAAVDVLARTEPKRTEVHVLRGDLLLRTGKAREALALFDSILVTAPTYRDAVLGRGTALARAAGPAPSDMYARTEQFAPSIRVFDAWLADHADDDDARLSRAVVLAWAGDLGRARPDFERLVNSPLTSEARKYLARITMWRGELEKSEEEWRDLVRDLPNDPDPLVGLGMSLRWQDRPGAAEPYLRKAAAMPAAPPEATEQVLLVNTDLSLTTSGRTTVARDNEGNALRIAQGQVNFHAPWQGRVELRSAWIQVVSRGITGDARSIGASTTWAPPAVPFSLRADATLHQYAVPTLDGAEIQGVAPGMLLRAVASPTRTVRFGVSGSLSRLTETVRMLRYGTTSEAAGVDFTIATIPNTFLVGARTWSRVHGDSGTVWGTANTIGVQYTVYRRVAFSTDWISVRNGRGGAGAGVWAPRAHDVAQLGMLLRPADLAGWSWAWNLAGGWQWTENWDTPLVSQQYGKADVTLRYRWPSRAEVAITVKAANSADAQQVNTSARGYQGGSLTLEVIRPLIRVRR